MIVCVFVYIRLLSVCITIISFGEVFLQCFDTVGWVAGRASDL